jgi:methylthioribose-1-phosphate isomerase
LTGLKWQRDRLLVLDQTLLPGTEQWIACTRADEVADCILEMKVRGAPAIGAAAAFGVALEAIHAHQESPDHSSAKLYPQIENAIAHLGHTRPTAVNLFYALDRMKQTLAKCQQTEATPAQVVDTLTDIAEAIAAEDVKVNRAIGQYGLGLFRGPVSILTHCNTGSLATVEYGTALGVIRALHQQGWIKNVYVDETRPFLQGARLTAYELGLEGIAHSLITDSMAGHFMKQGVVDAVLVGADRIAANGDTANKIGTYSLAVLCHHHGIPFYVAAPTSTFDLATPTGDGIPIEYRDAQEVLEWLGQRSAPEGTSGLNPAFDVTPADLIEGIITEHGVIHLPDKQQIETFFQEARGEES